MSKTKMEHDMKCLAELHKLITFVPGFEPLRDEVFEIGAYILLSDLTIAPYISGYVSRGEFRVWHPKEVTVRIARLVFQYEEVLYPTHSPFVKRSWEE